MKHTAKRSTDRIARSVAPTSSAPGDQCDRAANFAIGSLPKITESHCWMNTFADSAP
jgi:hypothetical protein